MCNCKEKPGFQQSLDLAKAETKRTGENHVVYYKPAVKRFFLCPESGLNDELEICCYYLSDGTEQKYEPKGTAAKSESTENESEQNPDTISDGDFKKFVDKGQVSKAILNSIAEKVKAKTKLTERENAIFVAKTTEINELIAG